MIQRMGEWEEAKKKKKRRMFGSMSYGDNSLKYYCKDSETQHKQAACPKCDLR